MYSIERHRLAPSKWQAALWLQYSNDHMQYTSQLMHGQPVNTSYVALGHAMLSLGLRPRDNIVLLCNITGVDRLPVHQLLHTIQEAKSAASSMV